MPKYLNNYGKAKYIVIRYKVRKTKYFEFGQNNTL